MRTITLKCVAGPLKGETFSLDGGPVFLFGRYPKAGYSLAADPAASHLHFLIDTSDNRVRVIDLGSTNGLVINEKHMGGKQGAPFTDFVKLKSGDTILAGACLFRLSVVDESTSAHNATSKSGRMLPSEHGHLKDHASTRRTAVLAKQKTPPPDQPAGRDAPARRQENGLPAIPGFTLIEKIGEGGSGVVYRAVTDSSGASAAIKMLLVGRQGTLLAMETFQREIEVTRMLKHSHIIRYLGDGFTGGAPYLALEYVSGGTLEELVGEGRAKRLDLPQAVPLFIQLLEAAAYLHGQGLVHRNIHPGNVLLDPRRGGSMAVKLSGLGLACRVSSGEPSDLMPLMAENGADGGKTAFMPPERLSEAGRALFQSDVYSSAATFYYMLTGQAPRLPVGNDKAPGGGRVMSLARVRPEVSPAISEVMDKALSIPMNDRYADGQAFLDAFRRSLA